MAKVRLSYPWRLLSEGLRTQGRLYAISIFAMLAVAASTALAAWAMEGIVNAMTESVDRSHVFWVAAMVAAIFSVKGLATYVQAVSLSRAGNRIVATQQARLYQKLLRHGVSFFNVTETSDLLMRVTQSAQSARAMIDLIITSAVRDTLTLLGLVAVMVYQQPLLSLVSLLIVPPAIFGVRVLMRQVRAIMEKEIASLTEIIKVIQETSAGIRIIKIFGMEDRMIARMNAAVSQVEKRANSIARIEAVTSPLMETLSGFAIAAVVSVSALDLLGGEPTTAGQLMSFITALLMAYEPAKRLSRIRITVESQMVGVRMMFGLLDQPDSMIEVPDAKTLAAGPGRVEFQNVSFGYRDEQSIVRDLNLVFEPGKTTALVGPSGSGKSTLINLVMRLYDPESGHVLIDGQDIRGVTYESLRNKISFVGQDTFLFSTTVMDNIRCSRPEATDADVYEAAVAAHAHEFIVDLPDGYATQIGENGAFLSGGQRQRLAIARAFLRTSEILVLDEATSALDAASEALVKDALLKIKRGVTTIIIAHRLSTILEADTICVLQAGKVVEQGTSQELLARRGVFKKLFDQQFGEQAERHH
ncbi:MAG: ABC transporter ATP-binding protein [Alphaproteobacteria bacterium HGW-Alphaproteobacteria-4]|nr:MAG: ABC transporter ATP-binding protein [Alphaproteobacteria bacterium HGW-Alphaproteobacteria-4]